jgi:hypothetical protein
MGPARERQLIREARLRALGFPAYWDYLKSPHWRAVRAAYKQSDRPQKCMCGSPNFELHHRTYERLGAELLSDLVALCRLCHAMVHVYERRGVMEVGSDLGGFRSPERAQAYAARHERLRGRAIGAQAIRQEEAELKLIRSRSQRVKEYAKLAMKRGVDASEELSLIDGALDALAERVGL